MKSIKMSIMIGLVCCFSIAKATNNPTSNEYKWGNNENEAKEKWALLNNFIGMKNFQAALSPTYWLLQNAPDLNVSLYVQAAKVYEENEKVAADPSRKMVLQDSALWVYEQRIQKFGNEAEAIDKEGKIAWKYLHERKGQDERLFLLYKHIFELNKTDMNVKNATYFMHSALDEFRLNKITKSDLLTIYSDLNDFLDTKVKLNSTDQKLVKNVEDERKEIEKDLAQITMSCDELFAFYSPQLQRNPTKDNAIKVKKALKQNASCGSNLLLLDAERVIAKSEKSAVAYRDLGKNYLIYAEKNNASAYLDSAYKAYETSLAFETNDTIKSKVHYQLAIIDFQKGKYQSSRDHALKILAFKPGDKTANELIGDLYMKASNKCNSSDVIQDKAVYMAAYEKYKLAGATAKMAQAKQYFPTMEEIFVRGKKEGDIINTGCWINENVRIMKR